MQDSNLFCAGMNRNMSEFKGNNSAADKQDAIRDVRQIQEILAVVNVPGAGTVRPFQLRLPVCSLLVMVMGAPLK